MSGAPQPWPGQAEVPATVYQPRADGGDDGPNIQRLANSGVPVVLTGTIHVNTQITLSLTTPVSIRMAAGCKIVANLAIGNAVFIADSISGRFDPSGGPVTTSGTAVVGSHSLTVSALNGLVAGNVIAICPVAGNAFETHTIKTAVGTTLTFTEPIERPFVNGSPVKQLTGLPRVSIVGDSGATITGTATYGIQFMGVTDSLISGIIFALALLDPGNGAWPFWLDWSCRRSGASNLVIITDATHPGSSAGGMEMCIDCFLRDIYVDQTAAFFTAGTAILITSCSNCMCERVDIPNAQAGFYFGASGSGTLDSYGCRSVSAFSCRADDASVAGFEIGDGGQGYELRACSSKRSALGVMVGPVKGGTFPANVHVSGSGSDFSGASVAGISVQGGAGHRFSGLEAGGGALGLSITGGNDIKIGGLSASNCTGATGAINIAGGTNIRMHGCYIAGCTHWGMTIQPGAGVEVTVSQCQFLGNGTVTSGGQVQCLSGNITMSSCTTGIPTDLGNIVNFGLWASGSSTILRVRDHVLYAPTLSSGTYALTDTGGSCTVYFEGVTVRRTAAGLGGGTVYGSFISSAAKIFRSADVLDFTAADTKASWASGVQANWSFTAVTLASGTATVSTAGQGVEPTAPTPDAQFLFTTAVVGGTPGGAKYVKTVLAGSPPTFAIGDTLNTGTSNDQVYWRIS